MKFYKICSLRFICLLCFNYIQNNNIRLSKNGVRVCVCVCARNWWLSSSFLDKTNGCIAMSASHKKLPMKEGITFTSAGAYTKLVPQLRGMDDMAIYSLSVHISKWTANNIGTFVSSVHYAHALQVGIAHSTD